MNARVLAGTAGGLAVVIGAAGLLQLSAYRIATGSMSPAFPPGTIVVDSALLPPHPLRAITFIADGKPVTHVLLGYDADGNLITRGLANRTDDVWRPAVRPRDVRGSVLFAVLFFAPAFWLSLKGVAAIIGVGCMVATVLLLRGAGGTRLGVRDRPLA